MRDYLRYIPVELLELILGYLNGLELVRLKQTSKILNNSLENPTALRIIFTHRFKNMLTLSKYVDDFINWNEEMNRLNTLTKYSRGLGQPLFVLTGRPLKDIKIDKKHIIINGDTIMNISSVLKSKQYDAAKQYKQHLIIGSHAAKIEPDQLGGYQIFDLLSDNPAINSKKLYTTTKGTLKTFNKNFMVLSHPLQSEISIWNLNVMCKHTSDALWKKSTKKKELCKECAYLFNLYCEPDDDHYDGAICSQINPKLILVPMRKCLHVIRPFEQKTYDIQNNDASFNVTSDPFLIAEEQQINIDGTLHHIVHCIVDKQHRFYDLTNKKMLFATQHRPIYKWIPNTCYFAVAENDEVEVVDIYQQKIISRFKIAYCSVLGYRSKEIFWMSASRSSPILFIAVHSVSPVVVMYSAISGARIMSLCRVNVWLTKEVKLDVTHDEKTLIIWSEAKSMIQFYDLKNTLICLQHDFKKKKDFKSK